MRRHHRSLSGALVACVAAALLAASPAHAQIDPGELGSLEQRRDELTIEISETDLELERLAIEIRDLESDVVRDRVALELVADRIEWTAFSREEPAATRAEIAIVGFTHGDPRQDEILNEVRTLQGDDEPSRRRAMYEAVIDDTENRLAVIDDLLLELRDELGGARATVFGRVTDLTTSQEAHRQAGILRSELSSEKADIEQRIEALRNLEARAVLTGETTFDDPTRPALAVKIDNVRAARPQAGINEADIVYVEEVEGGLTRLAAVFHSEGSEVVGPVRSMRTGDFDLLGQFNGPLFANSGGNRGTRGQLGGSLLVDVGVNAQNDLYYRDRGRSAPHNLFTNAFNLWSVGRDLEGVLRPSPMFEFRTANDGIPGDPRSISAVSINYGSTRVDYEWNGSGWDRSQDGAPTVDTNGERTAPTTVVIQFTAYVPSSADAASPEAISIGNGTAWILTAGQLVPVEWTRPELTDQTRYVVPGTPNAMPILPGKIWVELPRPDRATSR